MKIGVGPLCSSCSRENHPDTIPNPDLEALNNDEQFQELAIKVHKAIVDVAEKGNSVVKKWLPEDFTTLAEVTKELREYRSLETFTFPSSKRSRPHPVLLLERGLSQLERLKRIVLTKWKQDETSRVKETTNQCTHCKNRVRMLIECTPSKFDGGFPCWVCAKVSHDLKWHVREYIYVLI